VRFRLLPKSGARKKGELTTWHEMTRVESARVDNAGYFFMF